MECKHPKEKRIAFNGLNVKTALAVSGELCLKCNAYRTRSGWIHGDDLRRAVAERIQGMRWHKHPADRPTKKTKAAERVLLF